MLTCTLHGLRIRIEGADAHPDLFPILTPLPIKDGAVQCHVRVIIEPRAAAPALREIFSYGAVKCLATGDDYLVVDRTSKVRVSRNGEYLEARIDPRTLENTQEFANTTGFIALMLILRAHGLHHLHASALVGPTGDAVLIAGESGAGKKSSTLSLIANGFRFIGDDAVLVTERRGVIEVLRLTKPFRSANAMLPSMSSPALILFPEIQDRDTTVLVPITPAEAVEELMRSSALLMVDGIGLVYEQIALMARIVRGARSYRVGLGRELSASRNGAARLLATDWVAPRQFLSPRRRFAAGVHRDGIQK